MSKCLDTVLGPTLATSGLALQVPIAVVSDALLKHPAWTTSGVTIAFTMLGGVVILGAFFGLNMNDLETQEDNSINENRSDPTEETEEISLFP